MTPHNTAIYFLRLNCSLKKNEEQNPFAEQPFIDFWLRQTVTSAVCIEVSKAQLGPQGAGPSRLWAFVINPVNNKVVHIKRVRISGKKKKKQGRIGYGLWFGPCNSLWEGEETTLPIFQNIPSGILLRGRAHLSYSARAAPTKPHKREGGYQQYVGKHVSRGSGGWKSEVMMPAWSGLVRVRFLVCRWRLFVVSSHGEQDRRGTPSSLFM